MLNINYYFSGGKSSQPANVDYTKEILLTRYIIKYVTLKYFFKLHKVMDLVLFEKIKDYNIFRT